MVSCFGHLAEKSDLMNSSFQKRTILVAVALEVGTTTTMRRTTQRMLTIVALDIRAGTQFLTAVDPREAQQVTRLLRSTIRDTLRMLAVGFHRPPAAVQ